MITKSTIKRAGAQFFGFLAILQVIPDYSFILAIRYEIYQTSIGFPFLAGEWLLWSIAYDNWLVADNEGNEP